MSSAQAFQGNPILARVHRGSWVESVHRGVWVVVDGHGNVLHGSGDSSAPIFARSSVKCLQALPLIESGAAERFGFDSADLALALSSHSGEAQHTERVASILGRVGLSKDALRCGSAPPADRGAREALREAGEKPSALHHFCSGKHAGFLALAKHLGVAPEAYLNVDSASQQAVRQALLEMTELPDEELTVAIDGCSAPTFRLPLQALARAFARATTPDRLDSTRRETCQRLVGAVAEHPELVAGSRGRLCTALSKASNGDLFPKVGAEGDYVVGRVGHDQALAVKMDDGGQRGLHAVTVQLMEHLGWLHGAALDSLSKYRAYQQHNDAGLETGTLEVEL
ncbi:MAG: asparaginase [Planctomycetes bacterium]|nr:asparaginase [Planctomycetota bacterium]